MIDGVARGDGVGIEISDTVVRGVRVRHDIESRVSAAAEYPVNLADDNSTLDALVLLRAELGTPVEPTRIATFPTDAMIQRVDITGRSGPELNELRSRLDRRHGINSTVVADDGPRRWMLLIRWDAPAVRRLEDLAERAGFVDVTVEPTPMSLARVTGHDATYVRRRVAQGDAHHAVVSHRLPVAALSTIATGRFQPDIEISTVDVPLAYFEDFMTDPALAEVIDRVAERALAEHDGDVDGDSSAGPPVLDLVGVPYPTYPEHDLRSATRQAAALGAAVGAAGLAGPLRPVDMVISSIAVDDQFDRPWAIEQLSLAPRVEPTGHTGGIKRVTRRFRPRRRR
jgi:hypothetical protein